MQVVIIFSVFTYFTTASLCFSLEYTLSVRLHLTEKYNFLGISIVGQSNERGDGGIYIGSIMKGGAVAADGRIEPGDMLLQVHQQMFPVLQILIQHLEFFFHHAFLW